MAASLGELVERVRGFDVERSLGLRPALPGLALELDGHTLSAVRVKARRRGGPALAGHNVRTLEGPTVPATIFDPWGVPGAELGEQARGAVEEVGAKAGRVSLVLPDNLAKISLLRLPERPSSRRQIPEIIRFKMHRAVPFRFSEAVTSYQEIEDEKGGVNLLVALMRRNVIESFESLFESIGLRAGLIDLATPNLLNLCRERIDAVTDGDVGLLNCTDNYFSLAIVRGGKLIFLRCKSYGQREAGRESAGLLSREIANSFSYYVEKLGGEGIGTILVRSVSRPFPEIAESLTQLGVDVVEPIDPRDLLDVEGPELDFETGQRIAPALGAAAGRR